MSRGHDCWRGPTRVFHGRTLIYLFYFLLGWSPAPLGRLDPLLEPPPTITGFYTLDSLLTGDLLLFGEVVRQLTLPVLTLCLVAMAPLARMTRASMLAVLSSEFVRPHGPAVCRAFRCCSCTRFGMRSYPS